MSFLKFFSDYPGRTDVVMHDIELTDTKPVKQHPYRMHPAKVKILEEEVKEMLKLGVIERSHSDYSSPVVMIPKPDNTQRVCIDFRKLNALTKPDSFPIPRVDELIDRVSNSVYLTKIDLRKGYYQCPLTDRARPLTAFVTPFGLYQFRMMPFGLRNAPATFQRLMATVTEGMTNCACYIDDLCLYNNDWKSHIQNLREILTRLRSAGLTINLPKCEFGKARITYLGHTVGQGQVLPKEANVKAISNFDRPKSKREVKRFLGMTGFYRKFVQNFSTVAAPLTNLLKKNEKMVWSVRCQEAFEKLKAVLKNSPVLKAPDFEQPFCITTDASDIGAGSVLMQKDDSEVECPVAYFSRKFSPCQKNYSTIEKECLALVWAVQQFQVYIGSTPTIVYTDHNPLVFLDKAKGSNQRILRWSLYLQQFTLYIKHISGKSNVLADALSRN